MPQASQAEKRIGVIMTGDIPYYGAMHEAVVAELKKKGPQFADLEIILQRPFPDSISWSNVARKLIAVDVDLIVAGIPDPAAAEGTEAEIGVAFNDAYRMLKRRIELFLALPIAKLDRMVLTAKLKEIGRGEGATALAKAD